MGTPERILIMNVIQLIDLFYKNSLDNWRKDYDHFVIETLDNPGWFMRILNVYLDHHIKKINLYKIDRTEVYWFVIRKANDKDNLPSCIDPVCGPLNFEEMVIETFKNFEEYNLIKTIDKTSHIFWLQRWYYFHCNEDWEHTYGVKIKALNDQGWEVKIALSETDAEHKFNITDKIKYPEGINIDYSINGYEFSATCSPLGLDSTLGIFREFWIKNIGEIYMYKKDSM